MRNQSKLSFWSLSYVPLDTLRGWTPYPTWSPMQTICPSQFVVLSCTPRFPWWGIVPDVTGIDSDSSPSITTCWDLLPRKAQIQTSSRPWMPYWCSFHRSLLWLTLLKALDKSSRIMSVCLPTLAFLARSSMSMMSWVSHDLFSLKPCWRSYMRPCPSRCLTMLEARMCLRTLQRIQVREIGL